MEDQAAGRDSRVNRNDMLAAQMRWQELKGVGDPTDKEITRNEAGEMIPTTIAQRGSYAIGQNIAGLLTNQLVVMDVDAVMLGLKHAYGDEKPLMDEETRKTAFDAYMKFGQEKKAEQAELTKKKGAEFMAKNAKEEGVVTTESGLQYKVLKAGTGESPAATDKVRVHYHGTLLNGKVFDSSVERKEPAEFKLNGVISGWTEGLQLMKEGGKFRFWIPSELAYGERGAGSDIGPNETLIFDVELLKILD
jgi:FKBP-type peptidyl-prolyl cis-trans isomerase